MKSRDTLIRLRRFQVDEKRQQVADIEAMIADFQRMAVDLDHQIKAEEERAGISDVAHFAYPTFAKAALARRDNLKASIDDLDEQMTAAREELAEAFEELKKIELMDEREREAERADEAAREQAELDEIAGLAHQRAN